ncbi:MAG: adenylate/guanylate cyclase domain-containing protein [Gammaproteobacteria bacterium]|nr:adenylate/guanylate cyclase domain-containing protein [Gammaproteobacteria bacterium]
MPIELSLATWAIENKRFFSGIIRDITERKHAQNLLQESKNTLQKQAHELHEINRLLDIKNAQQEALSAKLAKYLSHQVYNSIFSGQKDVRVESCRKKLTVFFSDIQGFTELTDSMEPEGLCVLLNNYLNEMSAIALRSEGTLDKFIGDAIMIFFGDPETKGEKADALACVRMALEMQKQITRLEEIWTDRGIISKPFKVRMGINTGFCTVGNFGSDHRLDYTIVGGHVNLASRLEGHAEPKQILISHETYALVKDAILCEPRGEIKIRGMAYPVQTYQVIDARENLKSGEFKKEFDGFSLSIDFDDMTRKDQALASLEEAIVKIKNTF